MIFVNTLAFILMVFDKIAAIKKYWRTSENNLLFIASIGGVFGIWLGMTWPMYHKAAKQKFQIAIPCIALLWLTISVLLIK